MKTIALLTDGSAAALALARWLIAGGAQARVIEWSAREDWVRAPRSVPRGRFGRVVAIGPRSEPAPGVVDASDALAAASAVLSALDPIEVRLRGADVLSEAVREEEAGSGSLEALQRMIAPATPRSVRGRQGRPPGTDPFRGVGFDVAVTLLLFPDVRWTERALADATSRTPSAVHKVLVELARREYAVRKRGESKLNAPLVLRDDLARSWKSRVVATRVTEAFISPRRDAEAAVRNACRKAGVTALLAGAHAVRGPERLLGEPLTYYFDEAPWRALEPAGFERASRVGDVVCWRTPESGVFLFPRTDEDRRVVNRVVAFLDLVSGGSDRHIAAAEAVWAEP